MIANTNGQPSAVAAGLAFDPALPARNLLLDCEAVADRLGKRIGAQGSVEVHSAELVRVKYRIGESLRVVYRLMLACRREPVLVSARMFVNRGSATAFARSDVVAREGLWSAVHDAEIDTVWWRFPNDRRLRHLDCLLHPPDPVAMGMTAWHRSEVAEYAPERSLTVRALATDGKPVGYVKAFAPGTVDVPWLVELYGLAHDAVRVPAVLHAERDVFVQQAMPGQLLATVPTERQPDAMVALGEVMARFHGLPVPEAAPVFGRLRLSRLVRSAELVGQARPDLAALAAAIVATLCRTQPPDGPTVLLHGDCHPKNALLDGGRLTLIDLDQSGRGAAAADLGSALARIARGAAIGDITLATAARLERSFLAGYAAVSPVPDSATLRWYTAAALVAEQAVRSVNRYHPHTIARLPEVLGHARDLLGARP